MTFAEACGLATSLGRCVVIALLTATWECASVLAGLQLGETRTLTKGEQLLRRRVIHWRLADVLIIHTIR